MRSSWGPSLGFLRMSPRGLHHSGIMQTNKNITTGPINRLSASKISLLFCVCLCFSITFYCLETKDDIGVNKNPNKNRTTLYELSDAPTLTVINLPDLVERGNQWHGRSMGSCLVFPYFEWGFRGSTPSPGGLRAVGPAPGSLTHRVLHSLTHPHVNQLSLMGACHPRALVCRNALRRLCGSDRSRKQVLPYLMRDAQRLSSHQDAPGPRPRPLPPAAGLSLLSLLPSQPGPGQEAGRQCPPGPEGLCIRKGCAQTFRRSLRCHRGPLQRAKQRGLDTRQCPGAKPVPRAVSSLGEWGRGHEELEVPGGDRGLRAARGPQQGEPAQLPGWRDGFMALKY